ncbi:MAG TPA: class I SAM-dependent methyltransferase [Polyangiaceae bacterium]|nr:class I SAM-dependent methyltransferase [Polyangiaceae bacterium]
MLLAQQYLQSGAWDQALALCEARSDLDDPSVRLCQAVARFVGGETEQALDELARLREAFPDHLSARAIQAQMLARSGNRSAALSPLLELCALYPDYPGACGLLASLVMPGPSYLEVLARLHERLKPRSYLEIGVESGKSLALARHSTLSIGIDPNPHVPSQALPPGAQLFAETSDAFFAARTRESLLGTRRVDLSFIDGLHRFENALADFAHCERWAHADATIVLHDCLPVLERTTSRERATNFWVGDTWKVVLALSTHRPDLRIRTILCPPSGLIVVRRLNPGSTAISQNLAGIVAEFAGREWQHSAGQAPAEFQLVSNDERGWLDALG